MFNNVIIKNLTVSVSELQMRIFGIKIYVAIILL